MKALQKMKQYIMQRKPLWLDGVMMFFLLAGGYVYQRGSVWYDLFPEPEVTLINPYLAQSDGQGNVFVIDDERTRVVKINSGQEVEYLLKNNEQEADSFSYAEDVEVDPAGNIYLLDASWDETESAVSREAILVYDEQGRYVETLLEITYEDEFVDKHKLFALSYWNQALYFVESEQEGFYLCRVSVDTKEMERIAFYEYENAFNLIQDYTLNSNIETVYALDKRGKLLKGTGGELTVLYDTGADPMYAGKTALYRLVSGGNNSVYLADIKQNKLYRYTEGDKSLKVFADQGRVLSITSAFVQDGSVILGILLDSEVQMCQVAPNDQGESGPAIIIPQISGKIFAKSSSYLLRETIFQLLVLTAELGLLWLAVRMLALLSGIKLSAVQKNGLLAAGTAAVVAVIIVIQLLKQFEETYREELMGKLYILAHTVSRMVDGDSMGRIRTSEDYMNEDYQALMAVLEKVLNRQDSYVQVMYCNVLRYEDGKGYAIAYLDNSIGTYYPREEEETLVLAHIYETGQEGRNEINDTTGSYIYVYVPVMDEQGRVAGVIEVGTTTHVISASIKQMKYSVLVNLILVIMIVVFLFGEILSFFEWRARYRRRTDVLQNAGRPGIPLHLLRLNIFVVYIAFNAASSFMPVYAAGFVTNDLGLPRELAASLPLTLNMICVGMMSLFCAPLLRRFSFRTVVTAGAGVSMWGDMTMFLGQSYYLLVLGLIMNGVGMGLVTNSMNMFIAGASQEDVRTDGFSLFNAGSLSGTAVGMMMGAALAGTVGKRRVFACSAIVWALVMVLFWILGRSLGGVWKGEKHYKKKLGVFLASRGVVPYILFVQFPYVIVSSFVYYYVPIYGDAQGFSESIVCLFQMLHSLCSVYLSVTVTKYMSSRFRQGAIYLSSGLAMAALLLFGYHSTVPVLLIVLLVLGFEGSFGVSVRQTYFTRLSGVQVYGEESAMGVYNLMDNVGGSAGPMLFGAIMGGANPLSGLAIFAAVSGAANGIYAICNFTDNGEG